VLAEVDSFDEGFTVLKTFSFELHDSQKGDAVDPYLLSAAAIIAVISLFDCV
jgi:hypothetical protein